MTITLYKHNQIAYEKMVVMLEKSNKAAIIHPTGTGKSFIAFKFIEQFKNSKFLWLGPSEYIFYTQTNHLGEESDVLDRVEFMTYARVNAARNKRKHPMDLTCDYIILDEFHRIGASSWGKSVIELIDNNPKVKLIGLSATNIRYLDNERDMGEEIFGENIASKISLTEAIHNNILPSPNYIIALYSIDEYIKKLESQTKGIRDNVIREKNYALCKKLRKHLENAEGVDTILKKNINNKCGRYIVFCLNVEHLYAMISQVPLWFKEIDRHPHVYHIIFENKNSQEDFQRFLNDDSEHIKLMFCVDMLNEGIHIAGIDGVILLRHTRSPIIFKQQIGRALSTGAINTPVIFDFVNNIFNVSKMKTFREEFYEKNNLFEGEDDLEQLFYINDELADCRDLLNMIQRNLETTWEQYYEELLKLYLAGESIDLSIYYETEEGLPLGKWVVNQRCYAKTGALCEEKIKLLDNIGFRWEIKSDIIFRFWINELDKYKLEFGDAEVPNNYKTREGYALGTWLSKIRGLYNNNREKLTEEQIMILNSYGIIWNRAERYWQIGYEHAKEYYDRNGNLKVYSRYACEDGFNLGSWLNTQKRVYRGNCPGALTDNKIKLLRELGFVFEKNDPFEAQLNELDEYFASHGNLQMPHDYVTPSGFKMGRWVRRQKEYFASGRMAKRRVQQLLEHHMDEWGVTNNDNLRQ